MINKEIDLVFNTPSGKQASMDARDMRRAALRLSIPYVTTLAAARATVAAIEALCYRELKVKPLQDHHPELL